LCVVSVAPVIVRRLCCPFVLRRPIVLSSRRLGCCVPHASVALSGCTALMSSCCPFCLCLLIMLRCPLVLSLRRLVVVCRVVALSYCAALLSSRRAGWLLLVAMPLLPCHLALPSCPLVVQAGCCMSSCRPIVLWGPLVISSRRLVVTCRVASVDRVYDARPATMSSTLVIGLQTELTGKVAFMVIARIECKPEQLWVGDES
jgi:hypothetical protein